MADFKSARDSADARIEAAMQPFARDLARKAGVKPPTNPKERAEQRLSRPTDKAEPIIRKLDGLNADELRRIQTEITERLRETER